MFRKTSIHCLIIILLFAGACNTPASKPVILVSKEYGNVFMNWLSRVDNTIDRINMYTLAGDSITHYLTLANGIIISGGPDINPSLYGKAQEVDRCGPIDQLRDTLELRMIRYAMENDIPLLCICRGHQFLNAANKGTLIIDIPSDYDTTILHRSEGKHMVSVLKGSFLSEIVGSDSGLVNSRHHQAVEHIAPGFRASAYAPDGIVEAIEPVDLSLHPFILGVQWHPESMIQESDSPFTLSIAKSFMDAVHATQR